MGERTVFQSMSNRHVVRVGPTASVLRRSLRHDAHRQQQRAGDGAARRAAGHRDRARPHHPRAGPLAGPGAHHGARRDDRQADLRARPRCRCPKPWSSCWSAASATCRWSAGARHGCVRRARCAAARDRHGDGHRGVQRAGERCGRRSGAQDGRAPSDLPRRARARARAASMIARLRSASAPSAPWVCAGRSASLACALRSSRSLVLARPRARGAACGIGSAPAPRRPAPRSTPASRCARR